MCRVGSIERSGGVLVLEVGCGGLDYQVERMRIFHSMQKKIRKQHKLAIDVS